MRRNAHTLADRGHLKPDVTLEDASDVMWTYSSPELYELLVVRCGWDLIRYGRFSETRWQPRCCGRRGAT
jgi:hypothetical protein